MEKQRPYIFEHEVDTSKPKKTVYDEVFKKHYMGEEHDISVGDLPTDLLPTDIIRYESDPGYYSENNSWEPYTKILILRPRLETDDERSIRLERSRLYQEEYKQRRYKNYLKLKEEFKDVPPEKE